MMKTPDFLLFLAIENLIPAQAVTGEDNLNANSQELMAPDLPPEHGWDSRESDCIHETDPPPPLPQSSTPDMKYSRDGMYITKFRLHKLSLGYYADIAEKSNSVFDSYPLIRNNDEENPGNYYKYPYYFSVPEIDSADIAFLASNLYKFLRPEYYLDEIFNSVENVYLVDLKRKEFFFEVKINNTQFRLSGWYGKFIHVYVYTDFDSKSGFVEKARQYFKLPNLDVGKVTYDEEIVEGIGRRDFFYSYDDPNVDFRLSAYPFLKRKSKIGGADYSYDGMVIDLTIYPEEE